MKVVVFITLLFFTKILTAQDIDILHYKFEIELTDRSDTIYGKATIDVKFLNPSDTVLLDFSSLEKPGGKGMLVYSDVDSAQPFIGKALPNGKLALLLLRTPLKNEVLQFKLDYKGIPAHGLIISRNKHGDRTFFADNWPNRAHHWIPCVDRPDDKASFEFLVTAPSHYSVISNGINVEEKETGNNLKTTHWKEEIPQPTKVMVIGVAKFATKTYADSPKDIPVSAWVYPQDSTKGFYDYAQAPEILKFFSDYIAPYPYKKLANVQSKTMFGGMENASAIFYNENYVTGTRRHEDVIAHEIAHQWFGDMVSEKSFAHIWLSEGFADYFTNFYFEKKYGKEAAIERWETSRKEVIDFAKTTSKAVVDSTEDFMSLMNANSYQKGAWVLHMLRNEVGDTVFQKIIQTYYQQYKGSNAETRDFEVVAEKVSGKELTWFFDQWLYRPGIPTLRIEWEYKNGHIHLTPIGRISKYEYYRLPVEVLFVYKDGKSELLILNMQPNGHFQRIFALTEKPVKVILDPNKNLLFEEIKK